MKYTNRLLPLLLSLILCISMLHTAVFAVTPCDNQLPLDIDAVSVHVTEPVAGASPTAPTAESGLAVIDTYQWSGSGTILSETDTFHAGNKYRLILSIAATSDASFHKNTIVTVNGNPATIQSVNGKFIGCTYEFIIPSANLYHLRWDGMTARWDSVPGATEYLLTLYKDGQVITSISGLWKNVYDGSDYILKNGAGAYQFEIKACINGYYEKVDGLSPTLEYDGNSPVPDPKPTSNPFTDVKEADYFYTPVLWAVEKSITAGTSETTFSPLANCTRAQTVTFLYRAAGEPKVENRENPFTDVKEGTYYYEAVLWAVEQGITNGTSETTFAPDAKCTRGQIVTFQWRAAGWPEPAENATNPYGDVKEKDFFYKAVLWAVEKRITNGTTPTSFSPNDFCTRGQIVTFLYRQLAK